MHGSALTRSRAVPRTAILLTVVLVMSRTEGSKAQSIGLEIGWAGVENYDPVEIAFGGAIFYPFTERLTASLSYTQWTGEDGNAAVLAGDPNLESWRFYGNRVLSALLYYRITQSGRLAWSLGAGLGQYERWRSLSGDRVSEYLGAVMLGTRLTYDVAERVGLYFRADVGAPSFHIRPSWALARAGVEWRLST